MDEQGFARGGAGGVRAVERVRFVMEKISAFEVACVIGRNVWTWARKKNSS